MRVLLERMPHKPNVLFPDERRPECLKRVDALCTLHNCAWTYLEDDATYVVHAAEMYAPRQQ